VFNYGFITAADVALATEPVTLAEAKAWCKIDHNDEDALLLGLITGARQTIEGFTVRALVSKTVSLTIETSISLERFKLPYGNISGLVITDEDEAAVTTDYYTLRNNILRLNAYGDFAITYTAVAFVPQALKQAVLMEIAERYAHRGENVTTEGISEGAKSVAAQYVDVWV